MTRKTYTVLAHVGMLAICVCTNLGLIGQGLALHDSDQWIYPMAVNELLEKGRFQPFPFGLGYGGMGLSWLRALWVALGHGIGGANWLWQTGHFSFSYFVEPFLIGSAFYWMGCALFRRGTAFLIGSFASVGFLLWIHVIGMDCYTTTLLAGPIALAIRAKHSNPAVTMPPRRLFGVAVLFGFLTYNLYACLLAMTAFFFPWEWLPLFWDRFWNQPSGRFERTLRSAVVALFAFWLLLALNGRDIGTLAGKRVLLDAYPNLKLIGLLLLVFTWKAFGTLLRKNHILRAAIIATGWGIGMIPVWIHKLLFIGGTPLQAGGGTGNISYSRLWEAYRELLLGHPWSSYRGVEQMALLLMTGIAAWALLRHLKTERRAWPALGLFVINSLAIFKISNTSPGAARYFLGCYPLFFVMIGVLWEQPLSRWRRLGVVLLLVLSTTFLFQQRQALWRDSAASGKNGRIRAIATTFINEGLDLVATDDFWETFAYTSGSLGRVTFVSEGGPAPDITASQVQARQRIGLLLTRATEQPKTYRTYGVEWLLTPLARIGNTMLFTGHR